MAKWPISKPLFNRAGKSQIAIINDRNRPHITKILLACFFVFLNGRALIKKGSHFFSEDVIQKDEVLFRILNFGHCKLFEICDFNWRRL
jgi:hypothetical protein